MDQSEGNWADFDFGITAEEVAAFMPPQQPDNMNSSGGTTGLAFGMDQQVQAQVESFAPANGLAASTSMRPPLNFAVAQENSMLVNTGGPSQNAGIGFGNGQMANGNLTSPAPATSFPSADMTFTLPPTTSNPPNAPAPPNMQQVNLARLRYNDDMAILQYHQFYREAAQQFMHHQLQMNQNYELQLKLQQMEHKCKQMQQNINIHRLTLQKENYDADQRARYVGRLQRAADQRAHYIKSRDLKTAQEPPDVKGFGRITNFRDQPEPDQLWEQQQQKKMQQIQMQLQSGNMTMPVGMQMPPATPTMSLNAPQNMLNTAQAITTPPPMFHHAQQMPTQPYSPSPSLAPKMFDRRGNTPMNFTNGGNRPQTPLRNPNTIQQSAQAKNVPLNFSMPTMGAHSSVAMFRGDSGYASTTTSPPVQQHTIGNTPIAKKRSHQTMSSPEKAVESQNTEPKKRGRPSKMQKQSPQKGQPVFGADGSMHPSPEMTALNNALNNTVVRGLAGSPQARPKGKTPIRAPNSANESTGAARHLATSLFGRNINNSVVVNGSVAVNSSAVYAPQTAHNSMVPQSAQPPPIDEAAFGTQIPQTAQIPEVPQSSQPPAWDDDAFAKELLAAIEQMDEEKKAKETAAAEAEKADSGAPPGYRPA